MTRARQIVGGFFEFADASKRKPMSVHVEREDAASKTEL